MRSVLEQNYPRLEYVVMDGGSSDNSAELIRAYETRLAYWVSEPDGGQYDAINRGFARTSGEIMAWLNSDDMYAPWAFGVVATVFSRFPEIEWLTTLCPLVWDELGRAVRCGAPTAKFSRRRFYRGEHLPGGRGRGCVQQESTFWRRSLWERAGGRLDTSVALAADFELWTRFYRHARLYGVTTPLGGFRVHPNQKTAHQLAAYTKEATEVLVRAGGRPAGALRAYVRWGLGQIAPTLALSVRRRLPVLGRRYPSTVCEYVFREGWRIL
jgi:glycosyltransferase involved in cell wall biosynthesis